MTAIRWMRSCERMASRSSRRIGATEASRPRKIGEGQAATCDAGSSSVSSPGFNGSAGSSFAGSTTPTISLALSSLPASLSSSNNFEIGGRNAGACRRYYVPTIPQACSALLGLSVRPKAEGLLESFRVRRPYLRIDNAGRALAVKRHHELLGGDAAHIGARLHCHAGGMRGCEHVIELQQRVVGPRRLLVPHVDPGAGDLFCPQ